MANGPEGRRDDQGRSDSVTGLALQDVAAGRGHGKRRADVPAFRPLPEDVLQVEGRFDAHGQAGLGDRSRTPHRSPRSTPPEVVSKVLYLRQQYHFGPGKIADYLQRFHAVKVARASVHRLLHKHGMNRLPANQKYQRHRKRWQRYEKPQPGHRLQRDVKFLERIAGTSKRLYQFTAIDDCTRVRVLKVYDACNQRTAIRFMDEVLRRLPFRVHVVQTDNGLPQKSRRRSFSDLTASQ